MSKYELAVVVSAKLEDDARAEVIEKVKALVTRFGGNITDVDEWGKKRLAYDIQKMKEAYYYTRRNRRKNSYHGWCNQIFMRETGSLERGNV